MRVTDNQMVTYHKRPNNTLDIHDEAVRVSVPVLNYTEGDYHVVNCPALFLSAYGETPQSANKAFDTEVEIFIEDTMEKGTLEKLLLSYGWTLSSKLYEPPAYSPAELKKLSERLHVQHVEIKKRDVSLRKVAVSM